MSIFIDFVCDFFQVKLKQNWNTVKANNCSIKGNTRPKIHRKWLKYDNHYKLQQKHRLGIVKNKLMRA